MVGICSRWPIPENFSRQTSKSRLHEWPRHVEEVNHMFWQSVCSVRSNAGAHWRLSDEFICMRIRPLWVNLYVAKAWVDQRFLGNRVPLFPWQRFSDVIHRHITAAWLRYRYPRKPKLYSFVCFCPGPCICFGNTKKQKWPLSMGSLPGSNTQTCDSRWGVSSARGSSCTFFVQLLIRISTVLAFLLVGTYEQFAFIACFRQFQSSDAG
jgi:hypothetical protein